MSTWQPINWKDRTLILLDQRKLPRVQEDLCCHDAASVAAAIRDMVVRGAPAIGVTAAYGIALSAWQHEPSHATAEELASAMADDIALLREARPTAVNLSWAVDRCTRLLAGLTGVTARVAAESLEAEAIAIHERDVLSNQAIGRHGAELVPDDATLLTHCNAGALATAGYGTALGVVRGAVAAGKRVAVVADETRPFLQGARLTAWELHEDGIPVTVIADVAAGSLLREGGIDLVVVGADRIAANGDVANKIGTYPLAVLASRHEVPFYVAAPLSTVDFETPRGELIPIEERPAEEVLTCFGVPTTPLGVSVRNPAFDITPAELVSAIITERGICRAPYQQSLADISEGRHG